jgi:hypothetical protein
MVLTAYFVLFPVIGLSCHRRRRIKARPRPVGPTCLRQLDAGIEASEPHDFAVRDQHRSSARLRWLTGNPPRQHIARPTLPRPPHPVSYVRDDRETPLVGNRTGQVIEVIWVEQEREYFFEEGWTGKITLIPKQNFRSIVISKFGLRSQKQPLPRLHKAYFTAWPACPYSIIAW